MKGRHVGAVPADHLRLYALGRDASLAGLSVGDQWLVRVAARLMREFEADCLDPHTVRAVGWNQHWRGATAETLIDQCRPDAHWLHRVRLCRAAIEVAWCYRGQPIRQSRDRRAETGLGTPNGSGAVPPAPQTRASIMGRLGAAA